jgi:hypothetical protein
LWLSSSFFRITYNVMTKYSRDRAVRLRLAPPTRRTRQSGSALLIILGCVALLTILVTAFLFSARTEFTTSNFYAKGVSTKLLSENVINLVMAQLREGARSTDVNSLTKPQAWASQPGMIRTYDSTGNAYKYFKLYSWDNMVGTGAFDETVEAEVPPTGTTGWSAQPNIYTDLNEPVNGTYPIIDPAAQGSVEGFSYTSQSDTTNPLPMPVKWLYVLKDGSVTVGTKTGTGTAVHIANASVTNPIIGRMAFWTDDETCKVNINTASEGIFWDAPIGQGSEELGGWNGNFVTPWGFASAVPSTQEYQRMPGHPATTCLSAVFGFGTNPVLPVTGLEGPLQWPLSAATYSSTFGPYFSLTPRLQAGGSMGGAQPSGGVVLGVQTPFTVPGYRLYDSVDELAFDPGRIPISSSNDALYPPANGANPSGRAGFDPVESGLSPLTPQIIEQRRFFITAHSRAPEETLFGTPRISLWPLQAQTEARTAKDNLLAFCSTLSDQPYYFQRATYYCYQQNSTSGATYNPAVPSSQSATMDFPGAPTSTPVAPGTAALGNVKRNENLYAYLQALTGADIPGFGGNFLTKYPGANGITDRDQILTEMFDTIRSGVNTFDVATNVYPHYNYTQWGINGSDDSGAGSTVPISISNGTHGLGRNYTVAEVALVLTASDMDLNDGNHSIPETLAGQLDPTNPVDTHGNPIYVPGVGATSTQPMPIPPRPRRISVGTGLPWACEVDNPSVLGAPLPGATPVFLYWDRAATSPAYRLYQQGTGATAGKLIDSSTKALLPSTAVYIADPQTKAVQAFVIVRPYGVMPGPPLYRPNVRIRVTHLDQLSVTFQNSLPELLNFPEGSEAVAILNTANNLSSTTEGGMTEAILAPSPGTFLPNKPNQGPPPWVNDGTKPTTNYNYPLEGNSVEIPLNAILKSNNAAYPSPYGGEDDPTCTSTYLGNTATPPPPMTPIHLLTDVEYNGTKYSSNNSYLGSTLQINGTTLLIDVLDGTSPMTTAQVLQTVYVKIPPMTLPMPTVERALASRSNGAETHALGGNNGNQSGAGLNEPRIPGYTTNGGTPASLTYFWQMDIDPTGITTGAGTGLANRFNTGDLLSIINRGDIVRSFVVNPAGSVAGDMRLLAANPIQPSPSGSSVNLASDTFVPLGMERSQAFYTNFPTQGPAYGTASAPGSSPLNGFPQSLFIRQLHSLLTETGRTFGCALLQTSLALLQYPGGILDDLQDQNQGGGIGESAGALIVDPSLSLPTDIATETYSSQSAPVVTPELNGAFMDPGTNNIPGDWTLGVGGFSDGGFVMKPDEGEQNPVGTGYGDPYYTTTGNIDFSTTNLSYAPNRQIASAVVLGTLPSRAIQGIPWCTLLFCPNPAANDNGSTSAALVHPGFGLGSGTLGPTDVPPYTLPPDHLFLDLFWMPIVEPYAISEPFSTAGKVNMNYEMVPFGGYITRSTALHAVLKSTRITAVATKFNDAGASNPIGYPNGATYQGGYGFPSLKSIGSSRFSTPTGYGEPQYNYSIRYGINLQATIDGEDSAFQVRFKQLHDIFRSATEICNVFLVPEEVPGSPYPPPSVAPAPPTDANPTDMESWWSNFKLTGDNGRENPYNQIYPRLTTKSNDFEVHMRVQVLSQTSADRASGNFDTTGGDSVVGEYRGSAIVERYLDPNQSSLPDFATTFPTDPTSTVDNYIHYRIVNTHAFSP